MDSQKKLSIETLALHGGQKPDPTTGSMAVPIYQTTSYKFKDANHAAKLFGLEEFGNIYTRLMNPTTSVLEERINLLEGGVGALGVSSGMSAISVALLNIAKAGDEIVSTDALYGGTHTLLHHTFARFGITVRFVPQNDTKALQAAINEKTKAVYTETIGNPKLSVADIEAMAKVAHENNLPLVIDNTVAPYLIRPFDFGADVVVYSTTKFIGGHGTSIGGMIVDSGKFNWGSEKFPLISEPDESYHGINFAQTFGSLAYVVKARVTLLRDLGCAMSPFNAFLFLQGLETLHLRMPAHSNNALAVAEFLSTHPQVAWVNYPHLKNSPDKALAEKYLPNGASALVGFGVKGGMEQGKKFIEKLELLTHLANIGDAKSLAIHPASTTHQQLSEQEQIDAGVTPDFIRLSIGIENVKDIIADLDQALNASAS